MHSVSDLTTSSCRTTGDVPPRLVGASTTVVGDYMYLFGGRLVTERKMVADMFIINLETFVWEKIAPFPDDDVPGARYFHSTDVWNGFLVIFGGMGHKPNADSPDDLCVLNDVRFFDLSKRRWLPAQSENRPSSSSASIVPRARYAHLSSISSSRLFVIGGQDLNNLWLDDVCVFDLASLSWVQRREYPRHSGTYRSVAVAAIQRVRHPQDEAKAASGAPSSVLGPPGTRFKIDKAGPAGPGLTSSESLVHLPYSTEPTDDFPNDIYLYSNYNFTDVKRELEVFSPLPGSDFKMNDLSSNMTGSVLPPGLRFPTGAICGSYLIFAGTYLAHSYQSFSIWALNLQSMNWTRLDPGTALSTGSWFKGCLWSQPGKSKFIIFGNKAGNLVEDYNRRLLSWDDVACIDLEAFGIYQPPPLAIDLRSQELGLAALEEELLADFEIVCDDGRKIRVARKVLEGRWPWFLEQRKLFLAAAARALDAIPASTTTDTPLPAQPAPEGAVDTDDMRAPDPRLTPRSLQLSEPYPITLALMQYLYSLALITPLQHAPAVLTQLLLLSATYQLPHLQELVKHAMHRALSPGTSVGVYEVATLCSCQSLQIRALKSVMAATSRRAAGSSSRNQPGGGGAGGGGGGGSDGSGRREGSDSNPAARPRGMSDARGAQNGGSGTSASGRAPATNGNQTNGRQASAMQGYHQAMPTPQPSVASVPLMQPAHNRAYSLDSLYQSLQNVADEMIGETEVPNSYAYPMAESGVDPQHPYRPFDNGNYNPAILHPTSDQASYTALPDHIFRHMSAAITHPTDSVPPTLISRYKERPVFPTRDLPLLAVTPSQAYHSDSDSRSLHSTASMGSLTTSATSYRTHQSPQTPESPALVTPITPPADIMHFGGAPTLSAIEELSGHDEDVEFDSQTLGRLSREAGPMESSQWASAPRADPPIRIDSDANDSSSMKTSAGDSGGSSILSIPRGLFSSPDKAAKARAKAEKLEQKAHEFDGDDSVWMMSRQDQKALKAEEKRRKKEGERWKIEQLAAQLKGGPRKDDVKSLMSSTSSERKKLLANAWLEGSGGLYGGLGTW